MFNIQIYEQYFINNTRALWIGSFLFVLLSLYVFWRESIVTYTYKNQNAIFDFWFISAISGAIGGRVVYFIANWTKLGLKAIPWFWAPYEKINGTVYLLRLYPWRFFRLWDGGFIFAGMLVGYILSVYLLIIKKKGWKWMTMFVPAFNSAIILFGGILLMIGLYSNTNKVIDLTAIMLMLLLVFSALRLFIKLIVKKIDLQINLIKGLYILIVIAVNWFMVSLYFWTDVPVFWQEKISIIVFVIVSAIMIVHYILEKSPFEENMPKRSGIIDIRLNKPISLN